MLIGDPVRSCLMFAVCPSHCLSCDDKIPVCDVSRCEAGYGRDTLTGACNGGCTTTPRVPERGLPVACHGLLL